MLLFIGVGYSVVWVYVNCMYSGVMLFTSIIISEDPYGFCLHCINDKSNVSVAEYNVTFPKDSLS